MGPTAKELLDPRGRVVCAVPARLSTRCGIYALFVVNERDCAWQDLGILSRFDNLLYVGVATGGLHKRYHPGEGSCRTSSPRFSFGALLRERLALTPTPAKPGQKARWHFEPESERRLSIWMQANLAYMGIAWDASRAELEHREGELIRELKPPLNIKLLRGEDRRILRSARAACRQIARCAALNHAGVD